MKLTNIAFDPSLTAAGFTDNTASSALYIGKDVDLAVDGADITLGTGVTGDLVFDADATITHYNPARMVIANNSILSHMVKQNYTGAFTFPLGIADGDYTPATITNNGTVNTVHISVQDYAASASDESTAASGNGMQRTWNIYSDAPGTNWNINLQHNSSTNQGNFFDASHFVTQWSSTAPNTTGDATLSQTAWQSNTLGGGSAGIMINPSGTLAGSSMRNRNYTTLPTSATAATAYFTKSSNQVQVLPVALINFTAAIETCNTVMLNWKVANAVDFSHFEIERSTDGINYRQVALVFYDNAFTDYTYKDNNPVTGIYYYRLKMIDNAGTYKYSSIISVRVNSCNDRIILLYPNPARGNVTITGLKAGESIQLYGINGQLLMQKKTISTQENIDITKYPPGAYHVIVVNQTERLFSGKLIKAD